ncbi:L-lactate dehydrogenase [Pseudobythopirellula maris]|uniref:L-lactate dehydrogenase n=1 Tax=Pseudobythopirellula maris TaxID=2527991 RepID=A0A5C5ZQ17_9BACT|nr:lactate dehydrogenase [Pseudobythopirellula maris]TWT88433.1 L-lactate dehydrogenase [Pseudobythopirellula maris]
MKVSIIGMGHVGAATAHALMMGGDVEELVLVSRRREKAHADALDLTHAAALLARTIHIEAGDLEATSGSDLVVLAHSAPLDKPNRKLLAGANGKMFRETIPEIADQSPYSVLLVLSNPVDALVHLILELTDRPWRKVIGAGTLIDSLRFRSLISQRLGIHPHDVRAYVLGEHGETQFPAISIAEAGGMRVANRAGDLHELFEQARRSPWEVFAGKGYTDFAIAHAAAMVTSSMAHNDLHTLPVSTRIDGFLGVTGVCLSLPCVIGRKGVTQQLGPDLSADEEAAFRASAESVRETIGQLG